ncbi:MAG: DUF2236 domain-containing protein [Bacteroidetes bacterium]|nr:DUF2236 domain-containing protein [Fibrella sp.]
MATVIKTSRLFSDTLLTHYRQQGDPVADAVITAVVDSGGREAVGTLMRWLGDGTNLDAATQPAIVQQFFNDYSQLPPWADQARMARGIAFFGQNQGTIGLVLGAYSLPYTYLGADGAQLLWLTERIKNDTARRLQETGEWFFNIMNAKAWKSGRAVTYTLKIRLIHAAARWFGLHTGRWNMDWGYPVNQEDMAITNLSFSYVVVRGLRQSGISTTEADEEDYLHLINVIVYLNGLAEALLPQNLREAYQLSTRIERRQFRSSEVGIGLTKALLDAISQHAGQSGPVDADTARSFIAGEMRFFLGDRWANMLGIPPAAVGKRLAGLVNRLPIFPDTPFGMVK